MNIIQQKTLEFVFYDPITEGLWDRLMQDKLTDEDEVWNVFLGQDIRTLVKDLSISFQDVFDAGYLQGVNLTKGQPVK